jgi:hypothetical protein
MQRTVICATQKKKKKKKKKIEVGKEKPTL